MKSAPVKQIIFLGAYTLPIDVVCYTFFYKVTRPHCNYLKIFQLSISIKYSATFGLQPPRVIAAASLRLVRSHSSNYLGAY